VIAHSQSCCKLQQISFRCSHIEILKDVFAEVGYVEEENVKLLTVFLISFDENHLTEKTIKGANVMHRYEK
jgi:hypothetical protein